LCFYFNLHVNRFLENIENIQYVIHTDLLLTTILDISKHRLKVQYPISRIQLERFLVFKSSCFWKKKLSMPWNIAIFFRHVFQVYVTESFGIVLQRILCEYVTRVLNYKNSFLKYQYSPRDDDDYRDSTKSQFFVRSRTLLHNNSKSKIPQVNQQRFSLFCIRKQLKFYESIIIIDLISFVFYLIFFLSSV
jgi:hypothetical protein